MYNWSGSVPANAANGKPTGLILKQGDTISVVAHGWVQYGLGNIEVSSPDGPLPKYPQPTPISLVAKIANKKFVIGDGVLHKTVPVDGELILLFNDVPGTFGDNSGEFQVDVIIESRYSPLKEII
ncbi:MULTISPECIES: LecA/PA-IL family lectin [Photorhabdus]|uniref:Lectin n=2 Tax=Photorhabdus TaxID=29487 RepID=A0A329VSN8_9GAMM|nr:MULTISPECIES: LecA/PA-IL family lectin [Photorhabdus]PQQ39291.1 lectin [Photorhabdus luminescens]MBS9435142.1 lectin [Photorhabdus hainanensis]MCC8460232.1 lectin [Photorhabdus aegyptia]OCA52359.1 PA-I galactophilic lectin [Photorhabdus namnaonensis]RAW93591.1 lectin [Photorhabdus laumondii subsp. clarkei]